MGNSNEGTTNDVADDDQDNIQLKGYKVLTKITDNRFGTCTILQDTRDQSEKILRTITSNDEEEHDNNVRLYQERAKLDHPNIVKINQVYDKKESQFCGTFYRIDLIFELQNNNIGSEILIRKYQQTPFSEQEIWSILTGSVIGMAYLQRYNIQHQNLTAENLYVGPDGLIKLADPVYFNQQPSYSQVLTDREGQHSQIYLAPVLVKALEKQTFQPKHNPFKSDVFTLGMNMLLCISLETNQNCYDYQRAVFHHDISKMDSVFQKLSPELTDILEQMLRIDQNQRPDFIQLEDSLIQLRSKPQPQTNQIVEEQKEQVEFIKRHGKSHKMEQNQGEQLPHILNKDQDDEGTFQGKIPALDNSIKNPKPDENLGVEEERRTVREEFNQQQFFQQQLQQNYPQRQYEVEYQQEQVPVSVDQQYIRVSPQQNEKLDYKRVDSGQNRFEKGSPYTIQKKIVVEPENIQKYSQPLQIYSPPEVVESQRQYAEVSNKQYGDYQPANTYQTKYTKYEPKSEVIEETTYEPSKSSSNIEYLLQKYAKKESNTFGNNKSSVYRNEQRFVSPVQEVEVVKKETFSNKDGSIKGSTYIENKTTSYYQETYKGAEPKKYESKTFQNYSTQPPVSNHEDKFQSSYDKDDTSQKLLDKYGYLKQSKAQDKMKTSETQQFQDLQKSDYQFQVLPKSDYHESYTVTQKYTGATKIEENNDEIVKRHGKQRDLLSFGQKQPYQEDVYNSKQHQIESSKYTADSRNSKYLQESQKQDEQRNSRYQQEYEEPIQYSQISQQGFQQVQYSGHNDQIQYSNTNEIAQSQNQANALVGFQLANSLSNYKSVREIVVDNYQNGSKYEGEKLNGMRDGRGKFHYLDGGLYDGEWKSNKMHGKGILYYSSGKPAYDGDWIEDKFQGFGILYNEEPQELDQQFDYNDFDEIGDFWTKYDGEFKDDNKEGYGTLYLSNGEKFTGAFSQDYVHGPGTYYTYNNQQINGIWQENKLVQ